MSYVPSISVIGEHFSGNSQDIAFGITMSGVAFGMMSFPFIVQVRSIAIVMMYSPLGGQKQ